MFCPQPEHPMIIPDPDTLRLRRKLRYVFYGMCYLVFAKGYTMSMFSGIFQLFSVWIAYSAWASMFFCTLIFQLIYTAIDLLILWASWSGLQQRAGGSFFFQFILWSMVIVLTLAMYYSYRAYSLFKKEYNI